MRRLHLVGLTTDRDGLIFTARKGSKSGGFIVPLDDKVLAAITEAREAANGAPAEGAVVAEVPKRLRSQSALTPREMQARLRAGRSIEEVAAEAGVDTEWVARFAVPILAEQAQVVELARSLVYAKPRLGESAQPLGASVLQNLSDRGIFLPDDVADVGWTAFQLHDSVWMVRFRYRSRGRDQEAQWEVDLPAGRLLARNRHASDLGYVDPNRRRRDVDVEEEAVDEEVAVPPRRPRPRVAREASMGKARVTPAVKAAPVKRRTPARTTAKVSAKRAAPARPAKATKTARPARAAATGKAPAKSPAKAAAKSPTRRRPAKAAPAPEVGPTAGTGGVRMAVAQVSTARVAASLANADRAPWAAAVRRSPRPPASATPPPKVGAVRAGSSRAPRPLVVELEDQQPETQGAGVPTFQPRPLPAGGERSVSSRVRRVSVPRSTRSTEQMPAVSLPAPRPASPRQEPMPLERPKRRRLRSR